MGHLGKDNYNVLVVLWQNKLLRENENTGPLPGHHRFMLLSSRGGTGRETKSEGPGESSIFNYPLEGISRCLNHEHFSPVLSGFSRETEARRSVDIDLLEEMYYENWLTLLWTPRSAMVCPLEAGELGDQVAFCSARLKA